MNTNTDRYLFALASSLSTNDKKLFLKVLSAMVHEGRGDCSRQYIVFYHHDIIYSGYRVSNAMKAYDRAKSEIISNIKKQGSTGEGASIHCITPDCKSIEWDRIKTKRKESRRRSLNTVLKASAA